MIAYQYKIIEIVFSQTMLEVLNQYWFTAKHENIKSVTWNRKMGMKIEHRNQISNIIWFLVISFRSKIRYTFSTKLKFINEIQIGK